MINIHDKLLDQLDEQEYYLASHIVRHMGRDNTAWPSVSRLMELTGWSKPTVLKVRDRLAKKEIVAPERRKDKQGRDRSSLYRLITPLIGVFVTGDKLKTAVENRGKGDLPLGVNEIDPGGKGDLPEVLTNRSINPIVGKPDDVSAIPYESIVEYLNEKTGRSFRHNSKQTRKRIRARWTDGFTLEDFKAVIDVKAAQWKDDPKWSKYLRPETLFLPEKFESYLNEALATPQPNQINELKDRPLTEEQALKYLDYFQWVRDQYPRLFATVKMLTAKQYFAIRPGGEKYDGLRRWHTERKLKARFVQAHEEINTGLGIGRNYVDVQTELETLLKAPDYA